MPGKMLASLADLCLWLLYTKSMSSVLWMKTAHIEMHPVKFPSEFIQLQYFAHTAQEPLMKGLSSIFNGDFSTGMPGFAVEIVVVL